MECFAQIVNIFQLLTIQNAQSQMFDRVLNKAVVFILQYLIFANEGHHRSSVFKKPRFDSSDFFQSLNFKSVKLQTLIGFFIKKHSPYPGAQGRTLWTGEVLWNQGTSINLINLFPKNAIKKAPQGKILEHFLLEILKNIF